MTDDVEAERAAIVAWLRIEEQEWRDCGETYRADALEDAADAIERGDHHPRRETGSE